MSKTLLVAEKPSVGQDLARVLPGPFKKKEGSLEGPEHVVTWAVGHLVQLAEPEAYDAKFKSWRMADLPIVPDRFKLVVRDERSRKQMSVVTKQLGRDDVDEVVNACDAGREGELIFAYLYEKAKGKKPVKRLWLNSMTSAAMKNALGSLRPAEEFAAARAGRALALGGRLDRRHERHPRGHDQAAQLLRRRRLARAACRRPRSRSWPAARRRSGPSCPSPTGSSTPPSRRTRCRGAAASASTGAASTRPRRHAKRREARAGRGSPPRSRRWRSSPPARAGRARSPSWRRKSSARKRRCSTT